MSKNNVKVTVKLVDGFSKTLQKLEKQLDKIDKKRVSPKFSFDDNGQIDSVKAQLAAIDDVVNTKLNILGKPALKETQASVKSLSGVENVYVKTHDHELNATIAKMEALKRKRRIRQKRAPENEFLANIQRSTKSARNLEGRGGPSYQQIAQRRKEQALRARRTKEQLGIGKQNAQALAEAINKKQPRRRRDRGVLEGLRGRVGSLFARGSGGGKGGDNRSTAGRGADWVLYNLIPRGQLTQDLAAVFMPFMFTAYTAAMGALAAATAPAVAGIGALALGILGFGENAADSLHLAQVRMRLFGRELFKVFKPSTKVFAPMVDEWFKTVPHTLARNLNQPLQDMIVWRPTLEGIGGGMIRWFADFLNVMNDLEPTISRVIMAVGADTGDALIRFFVWLIEELDSSYDVIMRTLGAFKELAIFVYRVSLLWTQAIANLSGILKLVGWIANGIANSPIIGAIVSWGLALVIVAAVLVKILGLFTAIGAFVAGSFIASIGAAMVSLIGYLAAVFTALLGVGALASYVMSVLTLGAALVAGGLAVKQFHSMFGGSGGGSSAGSSAGRPSGTMPMGGNTINIYGNPDNSQIQKFKDVFPDMHAEQKHIDGKMTRG